MPTKYHPGSLTPEDAINLAGRLNSAEAAGWPKGFNQALVAEAWNEVLWTLSDDYEKIVVATPEIAALTKRRYMKINDPNGGLNGSGPGPGSGSAATEGSQRPQGMSRR